MMNEPDLTECHYDSLIDTLYEPTRSALRKKSHVKLTPYPVGLLSYPVQCDSCKFDDSERPTSFLFLYVLRYLRLPGKTFTNRLMSF